MARQTKQPTISSPGFRLVVLFCGIKILSEAKHRSIHGCFVYSILSGFGVTRGWRGGVPFPLTTNISNDSPCLVGHEPGKMPTQSICCNWRLNQFSIMLSGLVRGTAGRSNPVNIFLLNLTWLKLPRIHLSF